MIQENASCKYQKSLLNNPGLSVIFEAEGDEVHQVDHGRKIEFLTGGNVFDRATPGARLRFGAFGPDAHDEGVLRRSGRFWDGHVFSIGKRCPKSVQIIGHLGVSIDK
jgi:hypothetical protein